MRLINITELAQEFAQELVKWQRGKDPAASIPALLVTAAKVAAAIGERNRQQKLESMIGVLRAAYDEECAKHAVHFKH
jgi:hypothetical protein